MKGWLRPLGHQRCCAQEIVLLLYAGQCFQLYRRDFGGRRPAPKRRAPWPSAPEILPQWRCAPRRQAPQRRAPLTSCPSALCPRDFAPQHRTPQRRAPLTSYPSALCPTDVVPHNAGAHWTLAVFRNFCCMWPGKLLELCRYSRKIGTGNLIAAKLPKV